MKSAWWTCTKCGTKVQRVGSNPGKHKESLMRTHIKTCQKANGKPVGFKLTAYQ